MSDATGIKLNKTTNTGTVKNYVADIEYNGSDLEAIYHPEGRLSPNGSSFYYEYTIRDHLGNGRVYFRENGFSAQVLQENHYYPFGLELEASYHAAPAGTENPYQYNGKELHEDFGLGWYAYGARWYMPDVARWGQVDPLAEKMAGWSPYNYAFNNPIRFMDPDGTEPQSPIFDEKGNFLGTDSEGYTGEIIIMNAKTYNNLTDNGKYTLNHERVMSLTINNVFASRLENSSLSVEGYSNVYTHVLKQMEGEIVDGKKLSLNNLEGGIIHTIDTQVDSDGYLSLNGDTHGSPSNPPVSAEAMTKVKADGSINVTTRLIVGKGQMTTVEHIQSTLGVHEYYGHGIKNIPGGHGEPKAYRLEYEHKRTFKQLSTKQQNLIKRNAGIK